MGENARIWMIGGALILAGAVMAAIGASIGVPEVRAALPAMGAALTASGLTFLLVRLPLRPGQRG
jgi:hypothetical protein